MKFGLKSICIGLFLHHSKKYSYSNLVDENSSLIQFIKNRAPPFSGECGNVDLHKIKKS
jgi:hypothetical protein